MFWVDFLFQIVKVTIDGQLKFWWLCGSLSNRKNIRRSNSTFLINNFLYQEKMITREVEKRWPRGSALPIYRNEADAIQIDKFVAKLVKDDTRLFLSVDVVKKQSWKQFWIKSGSKGASRKKNTLPVKKCCQQTVHLSQPSRPSPIVEILFHLLIHISCNVCSKFTTFILMKMWELRKLLPPIIDFHFFSWSWEPKTLLKS